MKNLLSDVPSVLINKGIIYLGKIEKSNKYEVDMGRYHGQTRGVCHACFAGASIAQLPGVTPSQELVSDNFDPDTAGKLRALDAFRRGFISGGLRCMEIKYPFKKRLNMSMPEYDPDNPKPFKAGLRAIARKLKSVGL